MTLTKADLINQVHTSNPKMLKTQARQAVETILHIIKSSLEEGEDVLLSGFGKFRVADKPARKTRNPKTGESLMLEHRSIDRRCFMPGIEYAIRNIGKVQGLQIGLDTILEV